MGKVETRVLRRNLLPSGSLPNRILFHSDFDGICSAAILFHFFNCNLELEPVDYSIGSTWLGRRLKGAAVVDFLFHPDALWWFDHHTTSFMSEELRNLYMPDSRHRWNTAYPSCPPLILDVFDELQDVADLRREFEAWVHWCNIIDAARYESPWQATKGDAPCLLINQALSESPDPRLREQLVVDIAQGATPEEIADKNYITPLWRSFRGKVEAALAVIGERLRRIGQVGICDIAGERTLFLRYGVYCFMPEVRYSITAYDSQRGPRPYKVSLSFNPWFGSEENVVDLGALAREYGGGGRQTVGSIACGSSQECSRVAEEVAGRLHQEVNHRDESSGDMGWVAGR